LLWIFKILNFSNIFKHFFSSESRKASFLTWKYMIGIVPAHLSF
jgi:hypothetical protein